MTTLCESTFHDWDEQRMTEWLRQENLHDCVGPFLRKRINGLSFLNLSEFDIKTFQISQESKRKLTKVLKRIKVKRRNHSRGSGSDSAEIFREPKKSSAIPAHINHHDEGDSGDDWGSDFDSEDEDEEDECESDGDYIEPEADESLPKQDSVVPTGLVAQLRAGLNNGSFRKHPFAGTPSGHSHTQNSQAEDSEDIYDVPPEDEAQQEEFYEEPSDDSGSGIVVRPMDKKKVIRCPPSSSEQGEYIDARAPRYCDKQDTVPCPPTPSRPPKPGKGLIKRPPPVQQPSLAPEPVEIYDEVPEGEQPGCSEVVCEAPGGVEVYEPWEDGPVSMQDTYEIPDNTPPQDTYEIPDPQQDQDTYEIPEPEEAPPARPPPRGTGWNPPKPTPIKEKKKSLFSKKPGEQKLAKPVPASKPQISAKPTPPNPAPAPETRSSRLYPNLGNKAPLKQSDSVKRNSSGLPPPPQKQLASPPPQPNMPSRKEENNNERKITNEILNNFNSRLPPPRKQPPVSPIDDSPPLPPRPGAKPSSRPNRTSDADIPESFEPTSPVQMKSPLPPLPTQPKHPADSLKKFPWFHGALDKEIAASALKSFKKEGAFIVRNSSEDANKYSMSLFFNGKARHLRMPQTNGKYVLGDSGKVQFTTIVELVDYYSQHKVDLKSGGSTTLTAACPVK